KPRNLRRAHAEQRKSVLVIRVDQFRVRRRRRCENSQPGKRVDALECAQDAIGNRLPADAVEAVAACDDVALEIDRVTAMREADARKFRIKVVQTDAGNLEKQLSAGGNARL